MGYVLWLALRCQKGGSREKMTQSETRKKDSNKEKESTTQSATQGKQSHPKTYGPEADDSVAKSTSTTSFSSTYIVVTKESKDSKVVLTLVL